MSYLSCCKRVFPFRINHTTFYPPYLMWLRHLSERLGVQNTLSLWDDTFTQYDDAFLLNILSHGWRKISLDGMGQAEDESNRWVVEIFPMIRPELSLDTVRKIVESTPPIAQIKHHFSSDTVEKEITAYEALHLRFDGLACIAEALVAQYGKQGELIVYDLMVEGRLASLKDTQGSVEDFIEDFTSKPGTPNLFTAGLETELVRKTTRETIIYVRECEWARYFHERHPQVGYLMACSTDEVAYRAFNKDLRLQRTRTLMEGADKCDFRLYAVG